jgi:hypothetical protein
MVITVYIYIYIYIYVCVCVCVCVSECVRARAQSIQLFTFTYTSYMGRIYNKFHVHVSVSELRPPTGLLFFTQMMYDMDSQDRIILTGENRRTRRKSCPIATLSTSNSTWTDPGANPRLRGERPAANRL